MQNHIPTAKAAVLLEIDVFNPEADATAQNFNTAHPAFTGTATLDMSAAILPAIGHAGNIVIGDANLTGPIIGQFTVIPEPSPLLALRRRRP